MRAPILVIHRWCSLNQKNRRPEWGESLDDLENCRAQFVPVPISSVMPDYFFKGKTATWQVWHRQFQWGALIRAKSCPGRGNFILLEPRLESINSGVSCSGE